MTVVNDVALPITTPLVNGVTYYASQTIGGIESSYRLPITVQSTLGLPTNESISLQYAPNPVKDVLYLELGTVLKLMQVYNLLGQKVASQTLDASQATIDLSQLKSGNYFVKVETDAAQQTIRL